MGYLIHVHVLIDDICTRIDVRVRISNESAMWGSKGRDVSYSVNVPGNQVSNGKMDE